MLCVGVEIHMYIIEENNIRSFKILVLEIYKYLFDEIYFNVRSSIFSKGMVSTKPDN